MLPRSAQDEQDDLLEEIVARLQKRSPEEWARSHKELQALLRKNDPCSSSDTPAPSGAPASPK